jgi:predicted metal-dependent hydrolase
MARRAIPGGSVSSPVPTLCRTSASAGSCGKGARINFHWRSILLPPRIIEYVIVHELVHILEPHPTPAFWTRVERVMPDFAPGSSGWPSTRAGFDV